MDNYGKNDWEYWTTYLQDKGNTIWEAALNVATTKNGEKLLYDIDPIKKAEISVKSDDNSTIFTAGQSVESDQSTATYSMQETDENVNEKLSVSSMTTDRIDYLISDSGAGMRKDYAQKWITSISPTDFLNMTLGTKNQNRAVFDKMPGEYGSTVEDRDFVEDLKSEKRQTPYLAIDAATGKVVGHEGRHRMRALEKQGIEEEITADHFTYFMMQRTNLQAIAEKYFTQAELAVGEFDRLMAITLSVWDNQKNISPEFLSDKETLQKASEIANRAIEAVRGNKKAASGETVKRFSIDPNFENRYNKWIKEGKPSNYGYFVLGSTSNALRSIGINPAKIRWYARKIKGIQNKHPWMTDRVVKQIPRMLEYPILVMQSITEPNRVVVTGDVVIDGIPVIAALELRPNGEIENFVVVASAYERTSQKVRDKISREEEVSQEEKVSNIQNFINTSDILYVEPNKNRTNNWLSVLRLQLPEEITQYGPIGRVTYTDVKVNKDGSKTIKDPTDKPYNPIAYLLEKAESEEKLSVSSTDSDYLELAKDPKKNNARLREMLDEAAKNAGFPTRLLHGTQKFGFTVPDTSLSDDNLSFFATSDVDTAKTYSSIGGIRGIGEDADYDSIDNAIGELEEAAKDNAYGLADKISSFVGYYGYVDADYIHYRFSEIADNYRNGKISIDQADSEMYEFCDDLIAQGYDKDAYDGQEFWEWQESDEAEKLYTAVNKTIGNYLSLVDFELNAEGSGNYDLYANTDGFLVIDGNGAKWDAIKSDILPDITSEEYKKYGYRGHRFEWTTRSISKYAYDNGYRGVLFRNIYDDGGRSTGINKPADVYSFFYPQEQVKSADLVTYDDNGNIIPLSMRFNKYDPDIRYSVGSIRTKKLFDAEVGENKAAIDDDIVYDDDVGSAARFSAPSWQDTDYVTKRDETIQVLVDRTGQDAEVVEKWMKDIDSVAAIIFGDYARYGYESNPLFSPLKTNSEYKYTIDFSTLCKKRKVFNATYDAIQQYFRNTVLTAEDFVRIREMLKERKYEVACGICYVESTRKDISRITQQFIEAYREAYDGQGYLKFRGKKRYFVEEGYVPELADLNTVDGIGDIQTNHPMVWDAYLAFMNARGMQKPKLLETVSEYTDQILAKYTWRGNTSKTQAKVKTRAVDAMNRRGGLRLQSYSDFEVAQLIDMMQVVLDMATVGLKSQAYTKVPEFAALMGMTGVKINLSLIAKGGGIDENGNLIFDGVEGMDFDTAMKLRDAYSKNVGTILVGKNDAHSSNPFFSKGRSCASVCTLASSFSNTREFLP